MGGAGVTDCPGGEGDRFGEGRRFGSQSDGRATDGRSGCRAVRLTTTGLTWCDGGARTGEPRGRWVPRRRAALGGAGGPRRTERRRRSGRVAWSCAGVWGRAPRRRGPALLLGWDRLKLATEIALAYPALAREFIILHTANPFSNIAQKRCHSIQKVKVKETILRQMSCRNDEILVLIKKIRVWFLVLSIQAHIHTCQISPQEVYFDVEW